MPRGPARTARAAPRTTPARTAPRSTACPRTPNRTSCLAAAGGLPRCCARGGAKSRPGDRTDGRCVGNRGYLLTGPVEQDREPRARGPVTGDVSRGVALQPDAPVGELDAGHQRPWAGNRLRAGRGPGAEGRRGRSSSTNGATRRLAPWGRSPTRAPPRASAQVRPKPPHSRARTAPCPPCSDAARRRRRARGGQARTKLNPPHRYAEVGGLACCGENRTLRKSPVTVRAGTELRARPTGLFPRATLHVAPQTLLVACGLCKKSPGR